MWCFIQTTRCQCESKRNLKKNWFSAPLNLLARNKRSVVNPILTVFQNFLSSITVFTGPAHSQKFTQIGHTCPLSHGAEMSLYSTVTVKRLSAEVRDIVKVSETVLILPREHPGFTRRSEIRRFCCEFLIEVADIFWSSDRRKEGRREFTEEKSLPVHILREKRGGAYDVFVIFSYCGTLSERYMYRVYVYEHIILC